MARRPLDRFVVYAALSLWLPLTVTLFLATNSIELGMPWGTLSTQFASYGWPDGWLHVTWSLREVPAAASWLFGPWLWLPMDATCTAKPLVSNLLVHAGGGAILAGAAALTAHIMRRVPDQRR